MAIIETKITPEMKLYILEYIRDNLGDVRFRLEDENKNPILEDSEGNSVLHHELNLEDDFSVSAGDRSIKLDKSLEFYISQESFDSNVSSGEDLKIAYVTMTENESPYNLLIRLPLDSVEVFENEGYFTLEEWTYGIGDV